VLPGREAKFLAPLAVGDIPGVGKVMEEKLHAIGIQKIGDLAKLDDRDLKIALGNGAWRWPESHAVKTQEAGSTTKSEKRRPEIISHEHTFDEDTGDAERLQSTLMRLSEMVGRRLREGGYFARTLQLKLRYKDFTTITRAHSLDQPTQMDHHIFEQTRRLFFANWKPALRCACSACKRQISNPVPANSTCWSQSATSAGKNALAAADHLRDKFGEAAIGLARGMKADSASASTKIRQRCRGRERRKGLKLD